MSTLKRIGQSGDIRIAIRWLIGIAAFLFMFRKGTSFKWFDLIAVIVGILILFDVEAIGLLKKFGRNMSSIGIIAFCLFGCIVFAQVLGYAHGNDAGISTETLKSFGRIIFNFYILFLVGFLVAYDAAILPLVSAAILLAPVAVIQAYWNFEQGFLISGGRLSGFLQTPILFGAWMLVVFLVGLGVMLISKTRWQKAIVILLLVGIADFILWAASRASWLALVFTMALWVVFTYHHGVKGKRKARLLIVAFVFTFLVGYAVLPAKGLDIKPFVNARVKDLVMNMVTLQPTHIQGQIHTVTIPWASRVVVRNPLGFGLNNNLPNIEHKSGQVAFASSNSFLEVALYGGWGALFMFLVLLFALGRLVWRALFRAKPSDLEIAWLFAGIAFVIDIFFADGFLWRYTWFVFGAVLGITYTVQERHAGGLATLPTKTG